MRLLIVLCVLATGLSPLSHGQLFELTRQQMIDYTSENPYERFPDGRPKVPDALLEKVKTMSVEEAWGVLRDKGYHNQYAGGFEILHPGQKLVGRAMTAQYLPYRKDLSEKIVAQAKAAGQAPGNTQRVVDALNRNDVAVVSLMGGAEGHNFGGDNMHAALYGATGTGAVIDGTIRDLEGTYDLPTQLYFKRAHPAAVSGVTVVALNIPVHVAGAIVMPGDVVLGDRTGVIFIPPHLVREIVDKSEIAQIKDEWRKKKFLSGEYKASDLYGGTISPEVQKELDDYVKRTLEERRKND